jgi:hypothetical protein
MFKKLLFTTVTCKRFDPMPLPLKKRSVAMMCRPDTDKSVRFSKAFTRKIRKIERKMFIRRLEVAVRKLNLVRSF